MVAVIIRGLAQGGARVTTAAAELQGFLGAADRATDVNATLATLVVGTARHLAAVYAPQVVFLLVVQLRRALNVLLVLTKRATRVLALTAQVEGTKTAQVRQTA